MNRLALLGTLILGVLLGSGARPGLAQDHTRGRELADNICSACHLEPSPDILTKRAWNVTLAYMGFFLGMEDTGYLSDTPQFVRNNVAGRRQLMAQDGVLSATPLIDAADWQAIRDYYIDSAPEISLPQAGKPAVTWQLPQFRIVESDYVSRPAVTTLVRIDQDSRAVIVGDSRANSLAVLGADGQLKAQPRIFGPAMLPVDIEFRPGAALVASIGDLYAALQSEARPGLIVRLSDFVPGSLEGRTSVLIDGLYRTADMEIADLNGDELEDFIVSGFGGNAGRLSWFEARPDGSYAEHLLIDRPGAVRAQAHDFNNDGHLDIAVLLSHAREGFYILLNDGDATFDILTVFETHPGFGHTYFELQDFNADGRLDVLVVNGDNVDSDPYNTQKNYHGVRIFLDEGNLEFRQAFFYPMYGAIGAKARDFDDDGDLDIVAIAFYPDFKSDEQESFVYLENTGDLDFAPYSSKALNLGRWMTLDAADLDGDDDIDVILGGGHILVGMLADQDLWRNLVEQAPSVLVLKNIGSANEVTD